MITPSYSSTATERVLPRMALDFTTGVLDSRVTVVRALNTATRVNSSGLIESVNANLPRFDYDPITLAPKGLLIEELRTNLVPYSQDFSDPAWSKSNVAATADTTIAPDGTTTADTLTASSVSGFTWQVVSFTGNGDKTMSCFVKAGTAATSVVQIRDATAIANRGYFIITWTAGVPSVVRLTTGTVLGVDAFPDGWYRLRLLASNVVAANSNQYRFLPDTTAGTGTVIVWGVQAENGAFATSYIPTTTTSLTRNADVVSMTGTNFSDWYNQTEGSFVFQYSRYQNTDAFGIVLETKPSSTSTANRFGAAATSTADPRFQLVPNGTSILDTGGTFGVLPVNTVVKGAFAYRSGDSAATRNGASPSNSATAFATPTYTNLQIGGTDNGLYGPPTTSQLNGHIRSIRYYPQRIINAEVQSFSK
jgi:hypothetical protein